MKCPVCNIDLLMSERQGVEIDYCPECRGVWLDRGELDKIIERSDNGTSQIVEKNEYREAPKVFREQSHSYDDERGGHGDHGVYKKRKKESFLGELFDF